MYGNGNSLSTKAKLREKFALINHEKTEVQRHEK